MSSSRSSSYSQSPIIHQFNLGEGIQLEVIVSGASNVYNAKVDFLLKNCTRLFLLHWGGIYHGQMNWILPADCPHGTKTYKQNALQTPFIKVLADCGFGPKRLKFIFRCPYTSKC